MDDLGALADALRDASVPSATEGSFVQLVERYLDSSDISVRVATAETLSEVIARSNDEANVRLLEDSALILAARLIRLVPYTSAAETALDAIFLHTRPKEAILSLNESLSEIEDELNGRDGLSDTEEEDGASGEELAVRLDAILRSYTHVIPRLNLIRSTPTLLALADSLDSILPHLIGDLDSSQVRKLMASLNGLIMTCWKWVGTTSDAGGEQRAILTSLLNMTVTLLNPRIDARLAEKYFLRRHPRYAKPEMEDPNTEDAQSILDHIMGTLRELDISTKDLTEHIIRPSSVSPHASLAAVSLLAANVSVSTSSDAVLPRPPIEDCMPVLSAALSSSAIDSGLTYLWYLVTEPKATEVDYDNATMLVELLTPLIASAQSPISLTMVSKLTAAVIDAVKAPENRILLYKQLLEEANPFEMVRVRALNMLRDAISASNAMIVPALHEQLGPILYTIPTSAPPRFSPPFLGLSLPEPPLPPLLLDLVDLANSMWPVWFTECANLLRLLLIRDAGNASGCRDAVWLKTTQSEWIDPQMDRLKVLKENQGGEMGSNFALDRWEDALLRLSEEIKRVE